MESDTNVRVLAAGNAWSDRASECCRSACGEANCFLVACHLITCTQTIFLTDFIDETELPPLRKLVTHSDLNGYESPCQDWFDRLFEDWLKFFIMCAGIHLV